MIDPDRWRAITRAAAFAHKYAVRTFNASVASNSPTSPSGTYVGGAAVPPALHTITSKRPCRSITPSTSASTSAGFVASHPAPSTCSPFPRICAATDSHNSRRRLAITTDAPNSASAAAIACPKCVPPPVTTAARPVRSNISGSRIVKTSTQSHSAQSALHPHPRTPA